MITGDIVVGRRYACEDGTTSTVLEVTAAEVRFEDPCDPGPFTWSIAAFRQEHKEIVGMDEPAPAPPPNPKTAHGAQKPALCLIPAVANLHEAMAFEVGVVKYGAFNWRSNAVEAMTYAHAARRHLDAWIDGQECSNDTDPPVHNLGHARACLGILLDAIELGNLIDDRPPPGKAAEVQDRMKAAKVAAQEAREGRKV